MMTLYRGRRSSRGRNRLNHIRINCTLCEPLSIFHQMRFIIKNFYKYTPDDLSFFLRITLPSQSVQKTCRSIYAFYVKAHALVLLQDIFKLIFAQQSIVYKNTMQVFSYSLMKEYGSYGRIYAARQAKNYFIVSYFLLKPSNGGFHKSIRRPGLF